MEPGEVYFEEHDVLCWLQSNKPLLATSPSSSTAETLSLSLSQSRIVEPLLPSASLQETNSKSLSHECHKVEAPTEVKDKDVESITCSTAVLIGESVIVNAGEKLTEVKNEVNSGKFMPKDAVDAVMNRIPSDLSHFPIHADPTSHTPAAPKPQMVDEEDMTWKKGFQESPIKGKLKVS